MANNKFDPEGTGYDDATAAKVGLERDPSGHMASLDPKTGMLLKGTNHESIGKTYKEEEKLGNAIIKRGDRHYSVPTNRNLNELANIIYGEGASTDNDNMAMIGSSVLNRLDSGRVDEFGDTIRDIINKPNAYYAAQDKNEPYTEAITGNFTGEKSEKAYKRAMAVASGLLKGTIDRHKAQFYFTLEEEMKLRKKGKKAFNFDLVKRGEDSGIYRTYHY